MGYVGSVPQSGHSVLIARINDRRHSRAGSFYRSISSAGGQKTSPLPGKLQLASLSRALCHLGELRPCLLRRPN
jgi:hypothetical protein